jgi:hypothetical protein
MKRLLWWMLPALLAAGCGRSPADSGYVLELPDLPPAWTELLGAPCWRFEWVSPEGQKESHETRGSLEITVPQARTSPVSAWPFWPDKGIGPGIFRPAGALFPFDASGGLLSLSWRGGVEAFLYWELASAYGTAPEAEASAPRRPWNFNWPQFRELLDDPGLSEEVRLNPWTVDWKQAALRIVSTGFNRRRIVPEARTTVSVPTVSGPWIGASPFAPALSFGPGETPVFPAGSKPESWFSAEGLLRCRTEAWILIPWDYD